MRKTGTNRNTFCTQVWGNWNNTEFGFK